MDQPPPDDENYSGTELMIAIVAALAIAILGAWALVAYKHNSDTQNCFAEGRHNCAPIDMPEQ